jgi:hypothetical protein
MINMGCGLLSYSRCMEVLKILTDFFENQKISKKNLKEKSQKIFEALYSPEKYELILKETLKVKPLEKIWWNNNAEILIRSRDILKNAQCMEAIYFSCVEKLCHCFDNLSGIQQPLDPTENYSQKDMEWYENQIQESEFEIKNDIETIIMAITRRKVEIKEKRK